MLNKLNHTILSYFNFYKMKFLLLIPLFIFFQNTQGFFIPKYRFKRQAVVGWDNNAEPGYLPDYRGDKYTDPQRIRDTQALNKPFFDSIGGEPVYPGGVPPKSEITGSSNGYFYDQQKSSTLSPYSNGNVNGNSNMYSTNGYLMTSGSINNDITSSYTTSVNPSQIQRDYFVPNTYETSTTSYGVLNNGYVSSTTSTYNPVTSNSYSTNGPIWQSANPGFLPDYRGDKFTDPQRILDTQNLNKKFFESIGGEPVYPGGVPPKQNIIIPPSTV